MALQNQYANSPNIIIKTITIKCSVTFDISPASFKGILTIFPKRIRNSKKQLFVNGKEFKESFVYRSVISYFSINRRQFFS